MALPPDVRPDRFESPDRQGEVAAELRFHLESRIEALIREGVPPAEARERAEAEFGPVDRVAADCEGIQRHQVRRRSRLAAWRGTVLDLRATVRGLLRSPGYTALALVTFLVPLLIIAARRRVMAGDNTTGHVWDEDLRELNNPLPRWWMWLFVLTVVFSAGNGHFGFPGQHPDVISAGGAFMNAETRSACKPVTKKSVPAECVICKCPCPPPESAGSA